MKDEFQELINRYFNWLKDKTILKTLNNEWHEITTPHLDRHNDCLQIYLKKEKNGYLLTDDAYIFNDLLSSGCSLDTQKRQELLRMTLAGFGIELSSDNELTTLATQDNFPQKKHNLIQAMLAVNDLFYLAPPHIANLFYEDVVKWMDNSDIRYSPNIKFTGKSGYDHMFDFVIPKSKKEPERIIQTLTNPKKDNAEALMFKWSDTKNTRPANSKLFAILNDTNEGVSSSVINALKNYELEPVLWSERENLKPLLAA
jgi:hypothetical protein